MATFKFKVGESGSLNDQAKTDLPLGKHNYEIQKLSYVPVKSDKTGKRHHVMIELRHSNGRNYLQFLEITPRNKNDDEATRVRIAQQELTAYAEAVGIKKGTVLGPAKFKMFAGKSVGIEADKTVNKATKKEYVNVRSIVKGGFPEDELSEAAEAEEEEEEEEDPKPAAKRKTTRKKKPASKPDPDEEEEEEDEDDPDEEEEDEEPDEDEEEDEEEEDEDDNPFA